MHTRLYGHRLVFAWVVLGVSAAFALIVFVASLPVYYTELSTVCRATSCAVGQLTPATVKTLHSFGISNDGYVLFRLVSVMMYAIVAFAVAGVLVWRRDDEWMALLVAFMLVMGGAAETTNTVAGSTSLWHFPAQLVSFLSYPTFVLVFMLFPDGRFVPRWTRWLVITFVALSAYYSFLPGLFNNNSWLTLFGSLLFAGIIFSLLTTQLYRYVRVSTPLQRQQSKWIVFGLVVALVIEFVPYLLTLSLPVLNQPGSLYPLIFNPDLGGNLLDLLIPLSFAIAILRYRLWDIDVLINRALVYSTLTALLALLYFGLIIVLQFLLRELTSQAWNSPLVIVGSTLVIAALFQPLRRRIQSIIDQRFYRRKYDAARTLAAFSGILRNEVDLDQLSEQVVAVVEETMQPTYVSLWLRPPAHDGKQQALR